MNVTIDTMQVKDLESIRSSLTCDFDDFWTVSVFQQELENPDSYYIVAKIEDQVVGFAGIWQVLDEIHITNIVTKKIERNKGIGKALLVHLISIARTRNASQLTLEVNAQNLTAIHLYESHGFQKVGVRKKYYHHTDDALIMTLPLS